MPLTNKQAEQVKQQLLQQIVHFPEDKREMIKQQILKMNNQQLEEFLKQNQIAMQQASPKDSTQQTKENQTSPDQPQAPSNQPQTPQCIFCSILKDQIPSYKIDENKDNIAILEINPLSKGHSLVIPKQHAETEKIPANAFTLAKKIAKKIKTKFKPQEIKISSLNTFNHAVVEILPLYGDEKERKKASEDELKKLQDQIKVKPRKKSSSPKRQRNPRSLPKLKPRFP